MKPHCILAAALALLLFSGAAQATGLTGDVPAALVLEGSAGADLSFLSGSAQLTALTLADCPAADLTPLASCKKLNALTIVRSEGYAGGDLYDLSPLTACARLKTLSLSGPCAGGLAPLQGLQALTSLSLEGLNAGDYTPAARYGLKHLRLLGAPADQIAVIFIKTGKTLESAAVGDCALTLEANAAILSCSGLLSLRFERAEGLGTDAGSWKKLRKLSSLSMDGCVLQSLEFLSSFVATTVVKLENVTVSGVPCAMEFDKYFLQAFDVPSDALPAVLNGEGRQWLYAAVGTETGAVSRAVIEALAGIKSLLSLDVRGVAEDAFAAGAWRGFPKLTQLKCSGKTADLAFTKQLVALQRLAFFGTELKGAEALGTLYALRQLTLISCSPDGWEFLNGLEGLDMLTIAGCGGPDTLAFTASMPRLSSLVVENAPVTSLGGLTGPKLSFLSLYGCPLETYTELSSLPVLKLLSCNENAALPRLSCRVQHRRYIALSDEER